MPRRCAFGCPSSSDVPRHRFPDSQKFPERFNTWVTLVGGKLETASDFEYYKNMLICDIHFLDEHKNRNNRLSALAVPMLHLPGKAENQLSLEPASTSSQPLEPTVSQLFIEEQSVSEVNLGETTTSRHLPHSLLQSISSGTSKNVSTLGQIATEHNYSVISKPRKPRVIEVTGPLRTKIKNLRTAISRLCKKGESFKARLKNAENLCSNSLLQRFNSSLRKPAQLFLSMQLQAAKRAKGRRFTTEEKVLSLSLYKKSPKAYSFLTKIFTLPSARTMKRLLSTVKLSPGINPLIFQKIKNTLLEKNEADRLCSLIFDEMSLTPQVNYNAQKDSFEGFAYNNKNKFADHALVFMAKGLRQHFKQPIAYYFTANLNKIELKNLIIEVVKYAQNAGLKIINTVCDQSTVNVGAISDLVSETKAKYLRRGKEWRYEHVIINGARIIPLFDVPHLIKGIRNNLLTKDLIYKSNNTEYIVKWEYYQKVYAADKSYGELRLLDKITEEHINPDKINKMRVKSATQLFSHSVAVATEHLTARRDLPVECRQLIELTLLIDNVFDTLNVNTFYVPNGKMYKGPVKRHSPHHELWRKAKVILKTIKFRYFKTTGNKSRLIETIVPSVTNLIKTIEGMEAIWRIMSQKYGFDALLTRNFNQDPIENFFGNIRSYGARNNSPNTICFEGAYKALLINNYNSPHSARANCEEDSNECLQTLEFFFTENNGTSSTSDAPKENTIELNNEVFNTNRETDAGQRNYVCGWVLTKCLKNIVKTCKSCRRNLIDKGDENKNNSYIKAKEYNNKQCLCYPSTELETCFHDLQEITISIIKRNVPINNVKEKIKLVADVMIKYPFTCSIHKEKLKEYFINTTINVILYSWCRSVNRILAGKLNYDGEDEVKVAAQKYYNKHKHYKNKK